MSWIDREGDGAFFFLLIDWSPTSPVTMSKVSTRRTQYASASAQLHDFTDTLTHTHLCRISLSSNYCRVPLLLSQQYRISHSFSAKVRGASVRIRTKTTASYTLWCSHVYDTFDRENDDESKWICTRQLTNDIDASPMIVGLGPSDVFGAVDVSRGTDMNTPATGSTRTPWHARNEYKVATQSNHSSMQSSGHRRNQIRGRSRPNPLTNLPEDPWFDTKIFQQKRS